MTNMTTETTNTPATDAKPDLTGRDITSRELEILSELVSGKTNVEIGEKLKISVKTVEAHRARLFKKLGAQNAPDCIRLAYEKGLLKVPLSAYSTEELTAELARRQPQAVAS